jgi:hypothetical protein
LDFLLTPKTMQKEAKAFLCRVCLRTNTEGEVSERRACRASWLLN